MVICKRICGFGHRLLLNVIFAILVQLLFIVPVSAESFSKTTIQNSGHLQLQNVKKTMDTRCAICHGCYDAPCQLKLTSYQGLIRGATVEPLYNPSRLSDGQPTRLFIDAHSEKQWRQMGFHPVIASTVKKPDQESNAVDVTIQSEQQSSVLEQLLNQKQQFRQDHSKPLAEDFALDITRELSCPDDSEVVKFLAQNPTSGMPYGMAAIPEKDQKILQGWIAAGFPDFDQPLIISPVLERQVLSWEAFFNRPSAEQQLVSRYLFEHLFLGHLLIKDGVDNVYFRLIRSTTASGKQAIEIASTHPNGAPGTENFYYRLVPITNTLVDKTHFTYLIDNQRMERWQQLFFTEDWKVDHPPEYTDAYASNPFLTFQDIPSRSRYQFLLDDSHFFISNFIKGPVCRGQVALNVINDYFFVNFLSPDYDLSIVDDNYLKQGLGYLALSKNNPELSDFATSWYKRLDEHQKYLKYRDASYSNHPLTRAGFPLQAIWQDPLSNNDQLTVFRHFDSATVLKGFIGNSPATSWVLDYPTLERIYYDLVVNYNVFGSVSHQLLTRLYMDYLRMESESLLLAFLPASAREEQLKLWYQGVLAQAKVFYLHSRLMFENPTRVKFTSDDHFKELISKLGNRSTSNANKKNIVLIPGAISGTTSSKALDSLSEQIAQSSPWVGFMPEVVYLLVYDHLQNLLTVSTLLRNKAHTNVSFIFGESLRRIPEQDSSIVINNSIGSYPNLIFSMTETNVKSFTRQIQNVKNKGDMTLLMNNFGIRRTDPRIWKILDDLHQYRESKLGLEGILDMNRYHNH